MADDDNNFSARFGFESDEDSGERRDVSDSDVAPGGSKNSPEYDRLYNPQSENEFSNLPENQVQLALKQLERERHEQKLSPAMKTALQRVQYWPNVGRFVIPRANNFQSHLRLVKFGAQVDIHFDPDTYTYFDKVIATAANRPDLFDPKHKDYAKHEDLRNNLAVLRNDIMGIYMNDGSFDPGDEKFVPLLVSVAQTIGEGIANNKGPLSGVKPAINLPLLEVEGEGAAHVYAFLVKQQTGNGLLGNLEAFLRRLSGRPDHRWGLPSIEETPFSADKLYATAPQDELCGCPPHVVNAQCAGMAADQHAKARKQHNDVAVLSLDERNEALLHGHTILEWLKNIQFSDKSMSEWIETSGESEVREKTEIISRAILMFDMLVDAIREHNPSQISPAVQEAEHARKCLQHSLQLMAKLEKPVSLADTMQISSGVTQQPERWDELKDQTVDRLMETLKGGLEDAVDALGQQQEALDQQQEEQAAATNDAHVQGQAQRRRRRRRQARGTSAGAQRKVDKDLRADDRAANQGMYADKDERATPRAKASARQVVTEEPVAAAPAAAPSPIDASFNPVLRDLGKTLMQYNQEGKDAADKLAQQAEQDPPKPAVPEQNFTEQQAERRGKNDTKKRPRT